MRYFVLTILFGAVAASLGCNSAPPVSVGNKPVSINDRPVGNVAPQPAKPLTEMKWTNGDGSIQRVKDFSGKVVILDFWATYCPPCIEEIPHLMALKKQYGDDLVLIGLNVGGEEDKPKIPEFVSRLQIDYPIAYPEDALISYVFATESAIPQTAVFGRDGQMVKKIVGFGPQMKADLDSAVASAAAAN